MSIPTLESFVSHAETASQYLYTLESDDTFKAYRESKTAMSGAIKALLETETVKASALLAAVQELQSPRVEKKVREIALKKDADLSEAAQPITLSAGFIAIAKDYTAKHAAALELDTYNAFRAEKKAYKAAMKSLLNSGAKEADLKVAVEKEGIHPKFPKKVEYWTQHKSKLS